MNAHMSLHEDGSAEFRAARLRANILPQKDDSLFLFDIDMKDVPDAGWLSFAFTSKTTLHRQSKVRISASKPPCVSSSSDIYFAVHERLINSWISSCDKVAGVSPGTTFALEGEFFATPEMEKICDDLAHSKFTGPVAKVYRTAKFYGLFCEIMGIWSDEGLTPVHRFIGLSPDECERLREAKRIISTRYHRPLTIDMLGKACGLSRSRLTRGMRILFKSTVANLLTDERLESASAMLARTSEPVSSIAFKVGYTNNASFSRAFTRKHGVSPRAYRNEFRSLATQDVSVRALREVDAREQRH